MNLIKRMRKVAVIISMIMVIALIFMVTAERQRRQGRIHPDVNSFYKGLGLVMAPFSRWCDAASVSGARGPFPDLDAGFPRHELVRSRWREIRDEALAVCKAGAATPIKGDQFFEYIADDKWKKFYIKWYADIDPTAAAMCPVTCSIIKSLPEIHLAMFSVLEPGGVITPHTGPFKGALRYHLGLSCPTNVHITVDGTPYNWRDGEDVLFDDTYVHSVVNNASASRIILFMDVERPMRSKIAQKINHAACCLLGPLTTRGNDLVEKRHAK
jgi:beta-hydroxylase